MSDASTRARKLLAEVADARKEIPIVPSRPSSASAEHVVEEFFGLLADVVEENARLREALAGAKLVGHGLGQADGSLIACSAESRVCSCGADAHNARIDAALRGEDIVFVKVCASCGHAAHDPDCPEAVEILDVTLRHIPERP